MLLLSRGWTSNAGLTKVTKLEKQRNLRQSRKETTSLKYKSAIFGRQQRQVSSLSGGKRMESHQQSDQFCYFKAQTVANEWNSGWAPKMWRRSQCGEYQVSYDVRNPQEHGSARQVVVYLSKMVMWVRARRDSIDTVVLSVASDLLITAIVCCIISSGSTSSCCRGIHIPAGRKTRSDAGSAESSMPWLARQPAGRRLRHCSSFYFLSFFSFSDMNQNRFCFFWLPLPIYKIDYTLFLFWKNEECFW